MRYPRAYCESCPWGMIGRVPLGIAATADPDLVAELEHEARQHAKVTRHPVQIAITPDDIRRIEPPKIYDPVPAYRARLLELAHMIGEDGSEEDQRFATWVSRLVEEP